MGKNISYSSILKVFVVIACIWFLYQILDVVAVVIFSIIISSVIAPIIDKMQLYKIPRILGGVIIYSIIIFRNNSFCWSAYSGDSRYNIWNRHIFNYWCFNSNNIPYNSESGKYHLSALCNEGCGKNKSYFSVNRDINWS